MRRTFFIPLLVAACTSGKPDEGWHFTSSGTGTIKCECTPTKYAPGEAPAWPPPPPPPQAAPRPDAGTWSPPEAGPSEDPTEAFEKDEESGR